MKKLLLLLLALLLALLLGGCDLPQKLTAQTGLVTGWGYVHGNKSPSYTYVRVSYLGGGEGIIKNADTTKFFIGQRLNFYVAE